VRTAATPQHFNLLMQWVELVGDDDDGQQATDRDRTVIARWVRVATDDERAVGHEKE
jgi:hypothetical protein